MKPAGTASTAGAEDTLSGPTLPQVVIPVQRASDPGDSDDATRGEWLFKQKEMVLGPVTAIVLVERIKAGDLDADTPVARDGQPFKPLKLVPLFREAYEALVEQRRREREEREYNAAVTRARILRGFLITVIVLVPAGAGAVAGRGLMILEPWNDTPSWIAKAPPLVDLPPRPSEVLKPGPAAALKKDEPDEAASSGEDDGEKPERDDKSEREPRGGRKNRSDRAAVADKGGAEKRDAAQDKGGDKGVVKELTNEQAIAPLKDVKGALGACFKTELEANDEMPTQLVLSYTITEEGRSANVELTNRELRGRPVQDCVKKALAAARWPRFEGERKNVTVPFNIKKPPKPAGGPVTGGAPK